MDAIAKDHPAGRAWDELLERLAARMAERGAHPARTVVLLPYAQLMPVARAAWGRRVPSGFTPRFQTTRSWAGDGAFEPGELDFSFDRGRDLLTARALLARAGLAAHAEVLSRLLVDTTQQLAALAAAVLPTERPAWVARMRPAVLQEMPVQGLALESAVAQVALEWAAVSAYETDALLAPGALEAIDLLVILQGLQPDPLHAALAAAAAGRVMTWPLATEAARGRLSLHPARDTADEAERAAACVLRHVDEGRTPVALAATDRVLTRRIVSLLAPTGVGLRDEQGWKLSTTRSAAQVMAVLDASAWDAATDAVLDWLKHAPAVAPGAVLGLERRARRAGLREWRWLRPEDCGESQALRDLLARVNGWRDALAAARPLAQWVSALRDVLDASGQLARLRADDAGALVLDALRIGPAGDDELQRLPHAARRMGAGEFRTWVDEVLEAESFRPASNADAHVVVLPFNQALARPFAAIVLPGCDEQRLPASPDPAGAWTPRQRQALGLSSREALHAEQRAAWQQALQLPHVDILWRASDDQGEELLASPFVQSLVLEGVTAGADPRGTRAIDPAPVARPLPRAPGLRVEPVSASAYEDLRRCPYRYFALRQLGLRESDELDAEVDKRDFGNWVHSVLRAFHESLRDGGEPAEGRPALLDAIARRELAGLRLADGEFLPFEAGWPGVRDAYLRWLQDHEGTGARFVEAEGEHRASLGDITLFGRIDRIDQLPQGRLLVDYKTEGKQTTEERIRTPAEDTQLAFYAALLDDDDVTAAYLNIGERGIVKSYPQPAVRAARDLMRPAIASELGRIAAGAELPALGEGTTCEYCAARGLCRKDSWS